MTGDLRESLAAIARRWVEDGWRGGTDAATGAIVDVLHAPDFIDHDSGGRTPDNAGFREGIIRLLVAFPDFRAEVKGAVVEPATGLVTVRWTATGTHRGAYLGAAPTGRRIAFKGIEIIRIQGGLIRERWGEWDGMALLEQLGRLAP